MKVFLVAGTGETLEGDLAQFVGLVEDANIKLSDLCVVAVNRAFGPLSELWDVDYFYSWHVGFIKDYLKTERPRSTFVTMSHNGGAMLHTPLEDFYGSSSLQAVKACIYYLDAKCVVLAGVPLSVPYDNLYLHHWKRNQKFLLPYVRSLSGNTMDLLGEATVEWLRGKYESR